MKKVLPRVKQKPGENDSGGAFPLLPPNSVLLRSRALAGQVIILPPRSCDRFPARCSRRSSSGKRPGKQRRMPAVLGYWDIRGVSQSVPQPRLGGAV